jgi:hypothetical protein
LEQSQGVKTILSAEKAIPRDHQFTAKKITREEELKADILAYTNHKAIRCLRPWTNNGNNQMENLLSIRRKSSCACIFSIRGVLLLNKF